MGLLRDVIREAVPHARELLSNIKPAPPAPQAGGLLPPGSTSGPAFGPGSAQPVLPGAAAPAGQVPPPNTAPPTEGDQMWVIAEPWLHLQANNLHAWAAGNMEVELVAEMLCKSVPKKFWLVLSPADVIKLLGSPDWWERLTTFHPPLAPYQAWCDEVREELIAVLADEPAVGTAPDNNTQGGAQ